MKHTTLVEQAPINRHPLFFADNEGVFGEELVAILSSEFLPVILTKKHIAADLYPDAVFIQYHARLPKVPDNAFQAIYVTQGQDPVSKDLFISLYKEARRRAVPFIFITPIQKTREYILSSIDSYELASIFFYGELIDEESWKTRSSEIVQQAREKQCVFLRQKGLSIIYPVSKKFVVESIVRYSLIEEKVHKRVAFLPEGVVYEISLCRMLQKIDPFLRIDYLKKETGTMSSWTLSGDTIICVEGSGRLREALKVFFLKKTDGDKPKEPKRKRKTLAARAVYFSIVTGSVVLLTLFFMTFGMAFFGQRFLVRSFRELTIFQLSQAGKDAVYANDAFTLSEGVTQIFLPLANRLSLARQAEAFEKQIRTGKAVGTMLVQTVVAGKIYETMLTGKKTIDKQTFVRATQLIENNLLMLSQLQGEGLIQRKYREKLYLHQKMLDLFLATADVLPDVLGFDGQKKYLLLFQNNNELRPGGGFISSYAVVSVKNGHIGELQVKDVYDADGQLRGHVEPPGALKKYLGVSHWYLRDSNFSPDFLEDAGNAAFFLNLETGEKVDGVIALDTSVLKGIVSALSPLHLSESSVPVTEDNVVSFVEDKVQKGFFPGSSQKKDFLGVLFGALLQKMQSGDGRVNGALLGTVETSLLQKHILLAFAKEATERAFLLEGVSSSLKTTPPSKKAINDFFGVSEANVGGNKVNRDLLRHFVYALILSDSGEVQMRVTQTIDNTSTATTKYGGDYKVYLRYILAYGVSPDEISIDGVKQVVLSPLADNAAYQKRGAVSNKTLEVERVDERGRSTYGFFLVVPRSTKKVITLSYVLPIQLNQPYRSYDLTLFKQPGTGPDPYLFSLSIPRGYSVESSNVQFEKEKEKLIFSSRLTTDQRITFSYAKR